MADALGALREWGVGLLPALAVAFAALISLRLITGALARGKRGAASDQRFRRQLIAILVFGLATVAVVLLLPVPESTRNQLLALIGLVLTAAITLSSTTLVSNVMAGLVLRSIGNFRAGDFVRIGDQFGRVTERGLFHVEIQTEDSDLTTLPNQYLISQPMTVVRSTGTTISASLSLGYDLPHARVEPLLVRAAADAGLERPFTRVLELGDDSVTYKVAGFLDDPRQILSTRSALRRNVLDTLHAAGIEIVSPGFVNQRRLDARERVLPPPGSVAGPAPAQEGAAEDGIFDKAEQAQRIDALESERAGIDERIRELRAAVDAAGESERPGLALELDAAERRRAELDRSLERDSEGARAED